MWYGIKYLFILHDAFGFFYELSTLSFWFEHQGAWYVAMLIPVYLLFPWFYDWVENCRQSKLTRNVKIIACGLVISVIAFTISILFPQLYSHLSQVFSGVIIYVIGYYYAGKVVEGKYNGYLISVFCIAFYIVKAITPLNHFDFVNSVSWSLLAIPIITAASWFLSKVRMRFIDSVLDFFGRYSLEMYLWNIFLIQEIRFFGVIDFLEKYGYTSGYLAYGIVVVGEIVLSIVYEKISSAVILKMKQGKAS